VPHRILIPTIAAAILCALGLAACSSAAPDPYAAKSLKSLLPDQQSVIAKVDAGWGAELRPVDKKVKSVPKSTAPGSKCQAAVALLQTGGGTITEAASESWSSNSGPESLNLYRFTTAAQASAWKDAVRSIGKYCPEEYASEPHTAKIAALSDSDTDSVGFSTHSGTDGRWDLDTVRGTIGVSVESQSSESDAKELMVLAAEKLAKATP
jgi:hypothetical protein